MGQGSVRYQREGNIAWVTFDRPETRNAMTWTMYEQLVECCDTIDTDPEVRVAVFRGEGGKAFIAGTDISQFLDFEGADDGVAYEARIERIVRRLEAVARPTIAAVQGYAVGGGLTIVSACDIRLCTPDAKFGIPVARTLGNCLSMANHARLVALIGASQTKNLLLGAGFLSAEDARNAGLVREIVPPERLEQAARELAEQLAGHAPITMQVTKEAVRRLTLERLPDDEDLVRACYGSEDFREGVTAFVEKRKPQWNGATAELHGERTDGGATGASESGPGSWNGAARSLRPWIAGVAGKEPRLAEDAFVTPTAVIVGDVTIGAGSSVWYGSVLRADEEAIVIGSDCNVQDGCVLHADPGFPLLLGDRVSLGHAAIVHGARLEDDVLVGMNAVVLNGAKIGSGSVVAAGSVVREGMEVPPGSLVAGVPAKVKREASAGDREMIARAAASYKEKSVEHAKVRLKVAE